MKKYLSLVFLLGIWSCEDDKDGTSNNCNEIINNGNEALSLWSGIH